MSDQPSGFQRFWEDLKRRRVVRVAVGYTIAAWALVQVADILLPTFDAPGWIFRAVVVVAGLGFPVAVILAWVFDISDKHVVVTDDKGFKLPKWVKLVVALPLIGMVGVSGWWVWSGYVAEKESSLRPTDLTDQVPIVAVMSIRNITGNPDLDWYSEGLANLVRDNLTRSKYLRVVSPQKWKTIIGDSTTESEIIEKSEAEGIGFILGGEMLNTPGGILVTSRLTDTAGGVALSSKQVENLTPESLLTAAGPIATQVKQGLNVPREEQIDVFAADFATSNLTAYESYVGGLGFFLNYKYKQAEQSFNAALQLAPDFAVARYRLAYIQAVTGRTDQAVINMQKALDSDYLPDREKRYIDAALALFQRDYESAASQYEQLLEVYPFEIEARELQAKAYWGQYRADEAVRILERLVSEESQNQVLWSTLGGYLLQMGQFDRAQPALKRFSELAPNNSNSYALLGDSLRLQGKFTEARAQYQKALEIDPLMREVPASLATMDYLEGRYDSAQQQLAAVANNDQLIIRERLDAMFPLTALMAARGDYANAVATLESFADGLKEEQIREAMALSQQALYRLQMGESASARELVSAAIGLSPGVPTRYLFGRGLIELHGGQFDAVELTAQEITSHALPAENPDRTEEKAAAYLRGMSLLAQGQAEQALVHLQEAQSLEGYSYAIYALGLARAHLVQGDQVSAIEVLDENLKPDIADPRLDLEPDRVRGMLLGAEIQRANGNLQAAGLAARAFMQRFDSAPPSHPDALLASELIAASGLATSSPPTKKGSPMAALLSYP